MSSITLQGNASGTGVLTVAAPNTSSNYTVTLPTGTGTALITPVPAGTTTTAPVVLTSGTNLTTPAAGAYEFDGFSLFFTSNTSSGRGVVDAERVVYLNSAYTLTSQTAAQKLFNATTNGALTLAVGTYHFECFFSLSAMNAANGSFGFALTAGTAVIAGQSWLAAAQKGTPTLATATALQFTYNTAANTTLATASTNTVGYAYIRGTFQVTTAGTVIPQVSLGVANAAVVGAGSYFKVFPLYSTTAANVTVGNWS
jgi:hypothetical protein